MRTEDRPPPPALGPRRPVLPLSGCWARVEASPGPCRIRCRMAFDGSTGCGLGRASRGTAARSNTPISARGAGAVGQLGRGLPVRPAAFEAPSAGFVLDWQLLAGLRAPRRIGFATLTHAAGLSSTGDAALDARLPLDEPYCHPSARPRPRSGAREAAGQPGGRDRHHGGAGARARGGPATVACLRCGRGHRPRAASGRRRRCGSSMPSSPVRMRRARAISSCLRAFARRRRAGRRGPCPECPRATEPMNSAIRYSWRNPAGAKAASRASPARPWRRRVSSPAGNGLAWVARPRLLIRGPHVWDRNPSRRARPAGERSLDRGDRHAARPTTTIPKSSRGSATGSSPGAGSAPASPPRSPSPATTSASPSTTSPSSSSAARMAPSAPSPMSACTG